MLTSTLNRHRESLQLLLFDRWPDQLFDGRRQLGDVQTYCASAYGIYSRPVPQSPTFVINTQAAGQRVANAFHKPVFEVTPLLTATGPIEKKIEAAITPMKLMLMNLFNPYDLSPGVKRGP